MCHHPGKSCDHEYFDSGDMMFLICHATSHEHRFKGLYELWVEDPYTESPTCHFSWPLVYSKWRYKVFNI